MIDLDRRVAALAQAQYGHFTSDQLDSLNAARRARRHRIDSGRWERTHPGVFRLVGAPLTWESRVMAGCLTVDGSLASHLTAAHLWGLDGFGPVGVVDVTVPRHLRPRRRLGVRFHESLAFE